MFSFLDRGPSGTDDTAGQDDTRSMRDGGGGTRGAGPGHWQLAGEALKLAALSGTDDTGTASMRYA